MKVDSARRGLVEVRIEPSHQLFNHYNTFQAGVCFTLAEITGGLLCGTFLDLTKNLLITKKSEIKFNHVVGNTLMSIAELAANDIEKLLDQLTAKRKISITINVSIKSLNGKVAGQCRNEYYIRLGIPRSFTLDRQAIQSKGMRA